MGLGESFMMRREGAVGGRWERAGRAPRGGGGGGKGLGALRTTHEPLEWDPVPSSLRTVSQLFPQRS